MERRQAVLIWVLASAGFMVIGAFGPWAKVLALSVSGTDGSNDGWLVVAAAAIAALLFFLLRNQARAGLWPVLGGVAGAAIALYDRHSFTSAVDQGGVLAHAVAQVGWGLNLTILASVSLLVAGVVWVGLGEE
jgi:hypothetical protein